uniref:hypothetical protein n=1 Tax=Roseivirga sp. TaxID=1964215 RepID=UPI0040488418
MPINRKQTMSLWTVHDIIRKADNSIEKLEKEVEFDYWEPNNEDGRPITRDLAKVLIHDNYWSGLKAEYQTATEERKSQLKEEPVAIRFNKDLLLLLLSQPGCEGIRMYLAQVPSKIGKSQTLVLVGTDANDNDLKTNVDGIIKGSIVLSSNNNLLTTDGEDTITLEVGGHDTIGDFDPDFWN